MTKDNQMIMIAITFIIIIIIFYVIIIIVSHYLVSFARTLPRVFQISCATLVSEWVLVLGREVHSAVSHTNGFLGPSLSAAGVLRGATHVLLLRSVLCEIVSDWGGRSHPREVVFVWGGVGGLGKGWVGAAASRQEGQTLVNSDSRLLYPAQCISWLPMTQSYLKDPSTFNCFNSDNLRGVLCVSKMHWDLRPANAMFWVQQSANAGQ